MQILYFKYYLNTKFFLFICSLSGLGLSHFLYFLMQTLALFQQYYVVAKTVTCGGG